MSNPDLRDTRSYDLLWLSLTLLPLLGLSFLMTIPAQDYWWYLRLGQDHLQLYLGLVEPPRARQHQPVVDPARLVARLAGDALERG